MQRKSVLDKMGEFQAICVTLLNSYVAGGNLYTTCKTSLFCIFLVQIAYKCRLSERLHLLCTCIGNWDISRQKQWRNRIHFYKICQIIRREFRRFHHLQHTTAVTTLIFQDTYDLNHIRNPLLINTGSYWTGLYPKEDEFWGRLLTTRHFQWCTQTA